MPVSFRVPTKQFFFAALVMALALSGCDEINGIKNEKAIHKTANNNDALLEEASGKTNPNLTSSDPLTVSDEIWVGNQAMHMRRGQPLPVKLDADKGFALISTNPMSLSAIATQVANSTGIPVRVTDISLSGGTGGATDNSADGTPTSMSLSYEGPLSTFLDQVASQFDVSWRFDGRGIYFYRYETRTFTIESMPGKSSINDAFDTSSSSSSSSSSGTGGGTTAASAGQDVKQKNELSADLDYWKDLEAAVKSMLGSQGIETMMPSSGTITVSARPAKLAQLAEFIDKENKRLSKQIAIDLVVYSVTLDNTNNYGLNLTNVFKINTFGSAPGTDSIYRLTGPSVPSASSFTTATAGSLSIALLSPHWNANIIPQALSAVGNVAEITRSPVITLNNRPASREITVDTAYLASISTTAVQNAGVSTSVTPGIVTTGLALQMLPRILDDGRILLQYSVKLSDLVSIKSASSTGDQTTANTQVIQTPETANKIFVQQAIMQNGSTLVLAGFDKNTNTDNRNGIGSADNWLLGGGTANDHKREEIVITITPHEITPERGSTYGS